MKRGTAFHEAGHAVIALRLGVSIYEASIVGNDERGSDGHVLGWFAPVDLTHPTVQYGDDCVRMAGAFAAGLFVGGFQVGGSATAAFETGYVPLANTCESDLEFLSGKYSATVYRRMARFTLQQVEIHWKQIATVAGELEKRQTLSGIDIIRALESNPIERLSQEEIDARFDC
jgi:hypothetical protein